MRTIGRSTFLVCTSLVLFGYGCGPTAAPDEAAEPERSGERGAEAPADADAEAPAGEDASGSNSEDQAADASDATGEEASPSSSDQDPVDLVASVNGMGLPVAEFQRQAFDTQRFFVDRGLDPSTEEGQNELMALRRSVLLDMIHQSLIEQAAAEMNIRASDEEVQSSLDAYEEAVAETLDRTDVSEEDVIEMERKAIVGRKFVDAISQDVPTTARFYHARHVLCAQRAPCEAALTRLEAGEEFADVAAELSDDVTTADRGGDLDWIPQMDGVNILPSPVLEAAIFALGAGERSSLIESDFGYHVVEVVEIDDERALEDEQRFQLRQRSVQEWLAQQVRDADIIIYPDDLKDTVAAR